MPPVSRKQGQMFGMACAGKINPPGGMTREKACEFVRGYKIPKVDHVKKKKKRKKY